MKSRIAVYWEECIVYYLIFISLKMFRIVHICTYSHMHSPFVGKKKGMDNSILLCFIFVRVSGDL